MFHDPKSTSRSSISAEYSGSLPQTSTTATEPSISNTSDAQALEWSKLNGRHLTALAIGATVRLYLDVTSVTELSTLEAFKKGAPYSVSLYNLVHEGNSDMLTDNLHEFLSVFPHCDRIGWSDFSVEELAIRITVKVHDDWVKLVGKSLPYSQIYRSLPLSFLPESEMWRFLEPVREIISALGLSLSIDQLRDASLKTRAFDYYRYNFELYRLPKRRMGYIDAVNMILTERPEIKDYIGDRDEPWRCTFSELATQLAKHSFSSTDKMVMLADCVAMSIEQISHTEFLRRLRCIAL